MNLLDENIIASQRELLRSWKVSVRQIGYDFEEKGLQDDQIISLLHQHRRTTSLPATSASMIATCATSDTLWRASRSQKMKWRSLSDAYYATRNSKLKRSG